MSKRCPSCGRRFAEGLLFCAEDGAPLERDPIIGQIVAGREVLRFIGEGGAGSLFLVEHLELRRDEALKILHPSFAGEPRFLNRFLQEARIIARLQSPHTVRLFDFGREQGHVYILMEFLRGRTLSALMEQEGRLSPKRAAGIIYQICDSLKEAHEQGVIHRDIKPANVMVEVLGEEDHVRVLDFGVARSRGPESCKTQPGQFVGTPAYASPEQVVGSNEIDTRSDLYSLGILFYRLLTSQNPFDVPDNWLETLKRQASLDPPPPSAHIQLPKELDQLITEMIAKRPQDRPETAEQIRVRLAQFLKAPEDPPNIRPDDDLNLQAQMAKLYAQESALADERLALEALSKELGPRGQAIEAQETAFLSSREQLLTERLSLERWERDLQRQEKELEVLIYSWEKSISHSVEQMRKIRREAAEEWVRIETFRNSMGEIISRSQRAWAQYDESLTQRFQLGALSVEAQRSLEELRMEASEWGERAERRRDAHRPRAPQLPKEPRASTTEVEGSISLEAPELLKIPGGRFRMGSHSIEPGHKQDEEAVEVHLTGFCIAATPITQKLYAQVQGKVTEELLPQGGLSFYEAVEFCNRLSLSLGLEPCYSGDGETLRWNRRAKGYRLPTEAEWEYAARAGCRDAWLSAGEADLPRWACFQGARLRAVGRSPNAWGLCDLHGSVWEWCWDRYGPYPRGEIVDPSGPSSGVNRVMRGGSCEDSALSLRLAFRGRKPPALALPYFGLRLAQSLP